MSRDLVTAFTFDFKIFLSHLGITTMRHTVDKKLVTKKSQNLY